MYLETLFKRRKYKKLVDYATKYLDTEFAPFAYAQIAQAYYRSGSRVKAMVYYRKAIEKSGTDDQLAMGILENMLKIVGRPGVVNWCNEKLKTNPDSLPANLMMFELAQKARKPDEAIEHIDSLLTAITPESPIWVKYMIKKASALSMAYVTTSQEKYLLSAIKVFERILLKTPDDPLVLNDLAYLLADNNEQIDKAVEYAKRAHQALPNDGNILDTYAYTLYKKSEYKKAAELFRTSIQIFKRNSREIPWGVYSNLGMAQEELDQKADAAASYTKALALAGNRISTIDKEKLTKSLERVMQ
jgi:tetratricopeptide (TPR) repeat protein